MQIGGEELIELDLQDLAPVFKDGVGRKVRVEHIAAVKAGAQLLIERDAHLLRAGDVGLADIIDDYDGVQEARAHLHEHVARDVSFVRPTVYRKKQK